MKVLQRSKVSFWQTSLDGKQYYQDNANGTWYESSNEDTMAPFIPSPKEKLKIFAGIGSRDTPADVCAEITKFSQKMREKGWILRSGAAEGADEAFEKGYKGFEESTEIYLPWKKFRKHPSTLYQISEAAFRIAQNNHPNWGACNEAARKLLARNTYQVLGYDLLTPADLIVCWTKDGKEEGGTSQAIRIAKGAGIRIVNLGTIKT